MFSPTLVQETKEVEKLLGHHVPMNATLIATTNAKSTHARRAQTITTAASATTPRAAMTTTKSAAIGRSGGAAAKTCARANTASRAGAISRAARIVVGGIA